jgi:subtilase family serine protease
MSSFKRRVWPGALVMLCLLAGFWAPAIIPGDSHRALAQSSGVPDLIIDSITWSPEAPVMGDTVTFVVTIRNRGDGPAGPSHLASYIDETFLNTVDVAQIPPGATVTVGLTWPTQAGEHNITAVIDSDGSIAEANEANNEITYAFSVLAADLVIDSITWSPENPSIGDMTTFTVTIKNQGNKKAGFSYVEFWIDGITRGQLEAGRIDAGANVTRTYPWVAHSGHHTLKATADVLHQATEGDETNNDLTVDYLTAPPDLIISAITWTPENRSDSQNVTMSIKVKNQGTGLANGFWLGYHIDEVFKTSVFIDPLAAGATATRTYSWKVGAGEHTFTATADIDHCVIESDETNNTGSAILPALEPPDILIQSITWSPATPIINNWVTFTVTVKNAGTREVSNCNLDFYISYGYSFHRFLGPIPAGSTVTANFLWIAPSMTMNLRAVADPLDLIEETDETNNVKTASVKPAPRAPDSDLVVNSITCTPAVPAAGDTVTITASIKNNGPQKAEESHVAYYVDDELLDTVYLNELNPGATESNSITWTATIGSHVIRAAADYNDYIFETSETNNQAEVTLITASPDLVVQIISWSPPVPTIGDELTVTLTIQNRGSLRSGSTYVTYYIDGVYQGYHYLDDIESGATVTRVFPWTFQAEQHTFRAIVDEANAIVESDESNNEKTVVLPAPDLTIEAVTWSPTGFSENSTVTFTIIAGNHGRSTAYSPNLDCYIDDILQTRLPVNSIVSGASAAGLFTWKATPGEHIFRVVADGNDSITERDESNNEKVIDLAHPQATTEATPEPEPAGETEEVTTPAPVEAKASDSANVTALEFPTTDNATGEPDLAANIADDSSAGLKGILMNRTVIIGIGGFGGATIVALLLLRRRSKKS